MRYLVCIVFWISCIHLNAQNVIGYSKKSDGSDDIHNPRECSKYVNSLTSFTLDSLVVNFDSYYSPTEPNSPMGENCSTQMIVRLYEEIESSRIFIASYIFDTSNPQFQISDSRFSMIRWSYYYVIQTDLEIEFNEDLCTSGNSKSFVATIDIYNQGEILPFSSSICYAFDSDIVDYNDNVFQDYYFSDYCCQKGDEIGNGNSINISSEIKPLNPIKPIDLIPFIVNGDDGLPFEIPADIDISKIKLIDQNGYQYKVSKEEGYVNLGSLSYGIYFLIWNQSNKIINYKFIVSGF